MSAILSETQLMCKLETSIDCYVSEKMGDKDVGDVVQHILSYDLSKYCSIWDTPSDKLSGYGTNDRHSNTPL